MDTAKNLLVKELAIARNVKETDILRRSTRSLDHNLSRIPSLVSIKMSSDVIHAWKGEIRWVHGFYVSYYSSVCGIGGYTLAREISSSPPMPLLGLTGGLFLAALTLLIEKGLKHIPLRNLLGGFIGLILGIMVANLVSNVFFSSLYNYQQIILLFSASSTGFADTSVCASVLRREERSTSPGGNSSQKTFPKREVEDSGHECDH